MARRVGAPYRRPLTVILSEAKNLFVRGCRRFFGLRPQNDIGTFWRTGTVRPANRVVPSPQGRKNFSRFPIDFMGI